MKAVDSRLLDLLKKSNQFVVPIYQRLYSWGEGECLRFWDDIMFAGQREEKFEHFTGAIVYIASDQGNLTSAVPDLLIDGQQRVTTVTILLAALAHVLESNPEESQEPLEGFSPRKIRNRYLTNADEDEEKFFKLLLTQSDKEALKKVIRGSSLPEDASSMVVKNFHLFLEQLNRGGTDLIQLCRGLSRLVVVDVSLTQGIDDPQLVFETMNSTGKKLTEADLIRNFVLMDLDIKTQTRIYESYWRPMESLFADQPSKQFDEFVRHYLTLKTGKIPNIRDVYDAYKTFAYESFESHETRESLTVDLHNHATWYSAMAFGRERDPRLREAFQEIVSLRASVAYPFLLRLYSDYEAGLVDASDLYEILKTTINYIFRRYICRIPTNSLNKTFLQLAEAPAHKNYKSSFIAQFLTLSTYKRFPSDGEFQDSLINGDIYTLGRKNYLFKTLENANRKERVEISEYTIEHILPQNPNLSSSWKKELGKDWKAIQDRYLHTLGNLTLTGYNPEYSDRPFAEKRDMQGGFKESPLRLNQGLAQLETWNEKEIIARGHKLSEKCLQLWPMPEMEDSELEYYRELFSQKTGFDWSVLHSILQAIPNGSWTSYHELSEAIDTAPQPVANHVSKCQICAKPYRVMTWDGRIAAGFAWTDSNDARNPREVLEGEGVHFSAEGKADASQLLRHEDLLALVDMNVDATDIS